jgi:acetoin:2,6-dichlorophenolindophenol oxidoreductase subunit alpha
MTTKRTKNGTTTGATAPTPPRIDPSTSEGARSALLTMWTTRRFEEALEDLYSRGMLHGTNHLSIGQEAVAAGVCGALRDGDLITSTHRGHGHCIAHGADPMRMMAELLGRVDGYCGGRGGSMHIADVASGNLGANGIVAGSMTIAVGAALSMRMQQRDAIVVCFFGDGAANEGSFHEALNLAGVWQLPVLFLCENNQYGMSMAQDESTAGGSVAARGAAYGIDGVQVDGNDLDAVHAAALAAVERMRAGGGPELIEAVTYRYRGHSKSDRNLYRTLDEIESWRTERDPVDRFEAAAVASGRLTPDEVDEVRAEAREILRDAVGRAVRSPEPEVASLDGASYAGGAA